MNMTNKEKFVNSGMPDEIKLEGVQDGAKCIWESEDLKTSYILCTSNIQKEEMRRKSIIF